MLAHPQNIARRRYPTQACNKFIWHSTIWHFLISLEYEFTQETLTTMYARLTIFNDCLNWFNLSTTKIILEQYNLPILTDGGILPDDSEMNDPRIMKTSEKYDRDMKLNLDGMVNLSLLVVHSLIYVVLTWKWCFITFSHWNILCKMYCLHLWFRKTLFMYLLRNCTLSLKFIKKYIWSLYYTDIFV